MNKYYKNFILVGDMDQYCLLCKETFHLIPDIEKHIRWENHRKNIKEQTFVVPKFRKESVYKIGTQYYCEICNDIFKKMASVTEHVKSERHKTLKNDPKAETKKPAGLYDCGYIIIGKVILNQLQWHSIVENKCLICETEVLNNDEHMSSQEHMIKLIQSENKYGDNKYYRKINSQTYHCFVCKKIFSENDFEPHWESCENNDEIEIKKLKESSVGKSSKEGSSKLDNIERTLIGTMEDFYYFDEPNNTCTCTRCEKVMPIDFRIMLGHMKEIHNKPLPEKLGQQSRFSISIESLKDTVKYKEVHDHGRKRSILSAYGKERYIKLNHNGSKGYCQLCDKYLSAHKNIFKEHSTGSIHRGHLVLLGVKKPKEREVLVEYISQSLREFIYNLQYLKKDEDHAFWVNLQHKLKNGSMFFLHPIIKNPHYVKTKCFVCNEVFNQGDEVAHCLSTKHRDNFFAAKVLVKREEFVREVRPNVYHCGYCNVTLPFSYSLEKHLGKIRHLQQKTESRLLMHTIEFSRNYCTNITLSDDLTDEDFYKMLIFAAFGKS